MLVFSILGLLVVTDGFLVEELGVNFGHIKTKVSW